MDLVKSIPERIYPIGRLDYASEGLILFTNDGEFANRIMHPSNQVRRTYAVKLKGEIHDSVLERIREGVQLSDGFVKPQRVERSKKLATKEWIELVLTEGKNLEIRRIFALFQIEVDRLRRVSIGPVDIESVPVGKSRELSALEVKALLAGKNHLEK
jgi:23S rRNA pseudouridine2605 synthase